MLKESRSEARNTCCSLMAPLRAAPLLHFRKPLVCTRLISEDAVTPWRPNRCIWLGRKCETAAWRNADRENVEYISSKSNHALLVLQTELSSSRCKETEKRLMVFVPTKWGKNGRTLSQTKRFEIFVFSQNTELLCAVGKTFIVFSTHRIKCLCQEAAVPSLCMLSFHVSSNKVSSTWHNGWISGLVPLSHFELINAFRGPTVFFCRSFLNNCMGWFGRGCALYETGERLLRLSGEKKTPKTNVLLKKWTSVFVTSPRKWHILNVAM